MTTGAATAPPTAVPVGVRVLGRLAAAGTLPYLTIKLGWLSGATLGAREPAFLAEPAVVVANAVTFAMDLAVIGLAFALTSRWGERLPAWLVLLPVWVGTGFLVPMAVSVLPATAVTVLTTTPEPTVFEPWLQPVVYGGFAWQGVFLGAAFVAYAVRRWAGVVTASAPPAPPFLPLLRVIAVGGCVMAGASAAAHLGVGLTAGSAVTLGMQTVDAALAVAGAVGVVALVRARASRRWAATAAAWTGSAAMFSWGLYTVVVRLTADGFTELDAAGGVAQVTGLLGGFALAVAGMLALVGSGEGRRG
ncbi:hypothetical protein [Pseudonocardia kunmingensis]|uniref:Uncharacterized protein n=1 Tax=Pseudonocardia kunmingensis TaxID=630975 RepID=A0A543DXF7_9PSEU|nr:hypothetical protein [Pseudonocardia kunmingensis]TQM14013.1 hypothetical protein FB558_0770 [Pseudonocardia kunmingensis]